ncbi:DUF3568 family protein [Uliginosibacterium sp. H1]|uniref:DUF3568 family protein n=1 Tax=Uliginosibacterium sp. H1 TaxID=3114757 RepID=UPI002E176007|nr:DUF3568 family protein [Uliginosibacterium sp. H1]
MKPNARISRVLSCSLRLAASAGVLLALNGCAALAVSLAGAGAGAGLSHQMGGTASRTFTESFDRVDAASRVVARKMYLQVDSVDVTENIQLTRARVADLDVSMELQPLSPTLTRISVVARKNLLQVDGATAQEIVAQVDRALFAIQQEEQAALAAAAEAEARAAKYVAPQPSAANRKNTGTATPPRRKGSI